MFSLKPKYQNKAGKGLKRTDSVFCMVAGLALTEIGGLGELIEPGVTAIGIENAGLGFEEVGGPGVGGLLDSEMSSLVSFSTALRRSSFGG